MKRFILASALAFSCSRHPASPASLPADADPAFVYSPLMPTSPAEWTAGGYRGVVLGSALADACRKAKCEGSRPQCGEFVLEEGSPANGSAGLQDVGVEVRGGAIAEIDADFHASDQEEVAKTTTSLDRLLNRERGPGVFAPTWTFPLAKGLVRVEQAQDESNVFTVTIRSPDAKIKCPSPFVSVSGSPSSIPWPGADGE